MDIQNALYIQSRIYDQSSESSEAENSASYHVNLPLAFIQPGQPLEMEVNLKGFAIDHRAERDHQHLRGFHAHEFGDLSDGCINLGSHYNPHSVDHGGDDEEPRLATCCPATAVGWVDGLLLSNYSPHTGIPHGRM